MYVKSLRTNWKGECVHTLTERVLLTGPNGSGKSRVCEAIELCCTGQVSNFAGRAAVKEPRMLWRSKPQDAKTLYAEVTLSDGRVVRWEQKRSNGKPTWTVDGKPTDGNPVAVTQTVSDLRANLFGSPQKAEKYLSTALRLNMGATVDAACKAAPETNKTIRAVAKTTDSIATLLDTLAKLQREAAGEAKAAEAVGEELEHEVVMVSDEDLAAAEAAVAQATEAYENVALTTGGAVELKSLAAQMMEAQTVLELTPEVAPEAVNQWKAAQAIAIAVERVQEVWPRSSLCPCCRGGVGAGHLAERLSMLREYIASNSDVELFVAERNSCEKTMTRLRQRALEIRNEMDPAAFAQVTSGVWVDPRPTLHRKVVAAREALAELQAQRVGVAAPRMAKDRAQASAKRAELLKGACKAVEAAQADVAKEVAKEFATRAADYFPPHFGTAKIELRPKVEIAVDRDGMQGAPSGGEEATLLLAMAAVLTDAEAAHDGDDKLRLLVMDDRGLDRKTVATLFLTFRNWTAGQLFVPVTYRQDAPDWWSVVDCWPSPEASVTVAEVEEQFAALLG